MRDELILLPYLLVLLWDGLYFSKDNFYSSFTFGKELSEKIFIIPPKRVRYLSEISENKLFIDLTAYSDIQEFLITSDILISDYSSVVFDYSIY